MKIVGQFDRSVRRSRRRERVLKTVAVLPSLATLGNLVCGLGAVYLCLLSVQAQGADLQRATLGSTRINSLFPTFLAIGAYLIIVAMAFDGIDGRLARFTRKTSEFGAQLDSLADVVSFAVAPALLVLCIAHPANVHALDGWERMYWRAEWVMAAVYVCCAALRLARFNVENEEDESAHMGFRGLPTPGAACAVIGLVIFHQDLLLGVVDRPTTRLVAALMPPYAMLLGLLMVSRMPYAHLVNTLLRGRRTFRQVVALAIVLLIGLVVQFQLTVALVAAAYALSGPVFAAIRRITGREDHLPAVDALAYGEPVSETDSDSEIEEVADEGSTPSASTRSAG